MVDWEQFSKRWEYLRLNEILFLNKHLQFETLDSNSRNKYGKDQFIPSKLWVDDWTSKDFIFFLSEDRFEIVRKSDGENVVYGISF